MLNFKKPSRTIIAVAAAAISVVMLVAVLAVGVPLGRADSATKDGGLLLANSPQEYTLVNPTESDKLERMKTMILYDDGTAIFFESPLSSYMMPPCIYSVEDSELVFRPVIETEWDECFYGLKSDDIIARFEIIDSNTLVFKSATVPLFAEEGAKYRSR